MEKKNKLFEPIQINQMILKNRIIATPVGDCIQAAKNGAGLVITHSFPVNLKNAFWGPFEYGFSKYEVEKTHSIVRQVHSYGSKIGIEVFHAGNQAKVPDGQLAFGPCEMVNENGVSVKAMDRSDMDLVINAYVQEAIDAKRLGFDELFLHFGHGWLPAQFLSPLYNHRTDEYGGCIKNRIKFPLEILKAIRKAVGKNFPIDMRISAVEHVEGSITFEDTLEFLKEADQYIDLIQVSSGLDKGFHYEGNTRMATTNYEPHLLNVDYAIQIKKCVKAKVSVVGGIQLPSDAEKVLESGIDLVALGRPFIADPMWVIKAKNNIPEEITPCIRCLQCYHIATNHWNIGCSVNPNYTNETFVPLFEKIEKIHTDKKIMIGGAGPAGISAALTASKRGYEVLLVEKENEIGGMLRYVSKEKYKEDIAKYLNHLKYLLNHSNVNMKLNCKMTKRLIEEYHPDKLIIAFGSSEVIPSITGLDKCSYMTVLRAIENHDKIGNHVVIIGGGVNGIELAITLGQDKNKKIDVIELGDEYALQANMLLKISMNQQFQKLNNIKIHLKTTCKKIENNKIYMNQGNANMYLDYDTLVIATGLKSNNHDVFELYSLANDIAMVGDCVKPRKIQEAVFEGYMAGLNIQ